MFKDFLLERRSAIVKRWRDLTLDTYPADAGKFYKREKDSIANPVGRNTAEALEELFRGLVDDAEPEDLARAVDRVVRIRAVQDFSARDAVSFVFFLKRAVREEISKLDEWPGEVKDILEFESRVDHLSLLVFDGYSRCREELNRLRADELRNRSKILLERYKADISMSCPGGAEQEDCNGCCDKER